MFTRGGWRQGRKAGASPLWKQISVPPGGLRKGLSSPGCRRGLAAEGRVILQGVFRVLKGPKQSTEPSRWTEKNRSVSGESMVVGRETAVVSSVSGCLLKPRKKESLGVETVLGVIRKSKRSAVRAGGTFGPRNHSTLWFSQLPSVEQEHPHPPSPHIRCTKGPQKGKMAIWHQSLKRT